MNPENWFEKMHEAAEHPEKAVELARKSRVKQMHKKGEAPSAPPSQPPIDYLREWEQNQEHHQDLRKNPKKKE